MSDETLHFTIPVTIPSQNVRDRQHWAKRRKWDHETRQKINRAIFAMRRPEMRKWTSRSENMEHRFVHILSIRPRRITDAANLVGGAKGLVDQLTHCGIIHDDSDEWATITYDQEPLRGRSPATVITVSRDRKASKEMAP